MSRAQRAFEERYVEEPNTGCWLWTDYIDRDGYGRVRQGAKIQKAHRVAFERARGAIPADLVVDHLCRQRCCVNPAHLELVTRGENTLRGDTIPARHRAQTRCKRGHELHAVHWPSSHARRACRVCYTAAARARQE